MIKNTFFFLILALRIVIFPANEIAVITPSADKFNDFGLINSYHPSKFISIEGKLSDNKVMLTWNINENETADKFEVEKSTDGKNYSLAGLVFGTDKLNTDTYQFTETLTIEKATFRIKRINKNKEIEYSTAIEIDRNT